MENGSSTTTISGKPVFKVNGQKIYEGNWLSWRFQGKREHGKVYKPPHPGRKVEARIGHWKKEEFRWAVAEGRVPLESVFVLKNRLTDYEMKYIWAQKKYK